jgi:hypothetical protein
MDDDISPVNVNELWETIKLCRLVILHNQLGSEVILLFDKTIHLRSLRSLIHVGILTKLHEANCKTWIRELVTLEDLFPLSNDNLLNDKFRKVNFLNLRNMSSCSFPCKKFVLKERLSRFSSLKKDVGISPSRLFCSRFKYTKLVRFIIQDGISPLKLLFSARKYCSWVGFAKDNGISRPIFTTDRSK